VKEASVKAKNGALTDDVSQRCHALLENGDLNNNLYRDFGWLIFYNLKNTPVNDPTKRKQLLHYYLELELPRPELLHSLILSEAVKVEKNTPLQFRIRDFMKLWGWDNIRPEDWEQFQSDNVNTVTSLVEKLISVYAKEVKTDNVKSPDEFNALVDEALTKFPNNQNMPLYKAIVLMSLGKKDKALEYYKELILKSSSKCYLWSQASDLVEDVDLKIALLCKAISVERDESFIGGCRLNLAKALIEKNMMANAKYELDKYRDFYEIQGWGLKQEYRDIVNQIPQDTQTVDNSSLYDKYVPQAEEFIYSVLPSQLAIKIDDKMIDDRNRPGRKFTQWELRTKNGIVRLKKPSKFGLNNRMRNGTLFDIKLYNGRVVWIKSSEQNPLQQNWIKKQEGIVRLRVDRNGKTYAILDKTYVGEKLLRDVADGQNVKIVAISQEDGRWSAISIAKL
jgi:tetratricopeptide (TPR) repeat protein